MPRVSLVNQMLPSGPVVIPRGWDPAPVTGNSLPTARGVMRPKADLSCSVNQRFPSGPAVIPHGAAAVLMPDPVEKSVTRPAGVIRPIRLAVISVNHMLPSGPAAIPRGPPPAGTGNCVIVTAEAATGAHSATPATATAHARPNRLRPIPGLPPVCPCRRVSFRRPTAGNPTRRAGQVGDRRRTANLRPG